MHIDWKAFVAVVLPTILAAAGAPPQLTAVVTAGVHEAESLPSASGADKLQHVVNLATDAITGINTVKPGAIDATHAIPAIVNGVNTAIEAANAITKRQPPTSTVS